MKKYFLWMLLLSTISNSHIVAKDYVISTTKTSLVINAEIGQKPLYQYYGSRIGIDEIQNIKHLGLVLNADTYPAFGIHSGGEKAIAAVHSDGNMSLDLVVDNVKQYETVDGEVTEFVLKDKAYPFLLKQFYKAYKGTDIISTWIEISNHAKKRTTLYRFASAYLPVNRAENWFDDNQ